MRPQSNHGEGFLCAKFESGQPADKRAYFVRSGGPEMRGGLPGFFRWQRSRESSLFSLSQGSPQRSRLGQDVQSVREQSRLGGSGFVVIAQAGVLVPAQPFGNQITDEVRVVQSLEPADMRLAGSVRATTAAGRPNFQIGETEQFLKRSGPHSQFLDVRKRHRHFPHGHDATANSQAAVGYERLGETPEFRTRPNGFTISRKRREPLVGKAKINARRLSAASWC